MNILRKFSDKIDLILKSKSIDEKIIEELEETLFAADFGYEVTEEILDKIRSEIKNNKKIRDIDYELITKDVIKNQMIGSEKEFSLPFKTKPRVIIMIGINGAGKTTTSAKLAYNIQNQGGKVLLSSCDTFRAAANEQISNWANKINVEIISSQRGGDSASVAYDSLIAAKSRQHDLLIIDTAGRLHNKSNLMEELKKLYRVIKKQDDTLSIENWLIVDGSLGSNSVEQAKAFNKYIPIDGLIISKLDGTSRGGSLVGIYNSLKIPIYFIGIGEKASDLKKFTIENYLKLLFNKNNS